MTIAQVSKKFDISQDTLRYYERIGLIPEVNRTASGIRDYDEEACAWVGLAKCFRSAGVSIEALIEYSSLVQQGNSTISARKKLLEEEREKILLKKKEMDETLERLNYKISIYEEAELTGVLKWGKDPVENI